MNYIWFFIVPVVIVASAAIWAFLDMQEAKPQVMKAFRISVWGIYVGIMTGIGVFYDALAISWTVTMLTSLLYLPVELCHS